MATATATRPPPRARPGRRGAPRRSRRTGGGRVLNYVLLGVLFLVLLFPVYYGFIGSFMTPATSTRFPPRLWPTSGFVAENYANALDVIPLGRQYLNSAAVAVLVVARPAADERRWRRTRWCSCGCAGGGSGSPCCSAR